jgi:type IV pilus assembly protein PilP
LIRRRLVRKIVLGGLGFLLLAGCGEEAPQKPTTTVIQKKIQKPQPQPPPKVVKKEPPGQPQPSSLEEPAKKEEPAKELVYEYDPGDRPDPFRPFHEEVKVQMATGECEELVPGPLTEMELAQFSLVAIVTQGQEKVAMVQDKSGKGYMVRTGSFMGKKCGKVVEISPSEGLVVEEPYVDLLGVKRTRRVTLGFKTSHGGGR